VVFGLRQSLFEHTIIVIKKGKWKILNTSAKKKRSQNGKLNKKSNLIVIEYDIKENEKFHWFINFE
jgi:hypothetical protein